MVGDFWSLRTERGRRHVIGSRTDAPLQVYSTTTRLMIVATTSKMFSPAKAESLLFQTTSGRKPLHHHDTVAFRLPRLTCGDLTNLFCMLVALAGLVILGCSGDYTLVGKTLALVGGCGLGAGMMNALFVHLLFRRVRGCVGAGVFHRQAKEIAIQLQRLMVHTFFSPTTLAGYAKSFDSRQGAVTATVRSRLDQPDSHIALVNAFTSVASTPSVLQRLSQEIGNFLHTRAMRLEPAEVAAMLQTLVAPHLTWIVVWGNVFGLVLGGIVALCTLNMSPSPP
ncbi:hypothetical protein DYB30_009887 [Aphanomyces astaci]|uniref:Uncharacterized protein n=1 Tax=Aphanomyces astaci TaxID=112090 RepID=A0A397E625_APHAT|nr:hypothetical protein DYB30_009887 [Aphanomyces astaci]